MKNLLVFVLGFISGVAFTFFAAIVISNTTDTNNNGMIFFEQPGKCLSTKSFEVMQVIDDNHALAHEMEWDSYLKKYEQTDLLVLVTNDNGEYYYDEQLIKIPKGKCMRQVGVYKYKNRMDVVKTVPIVKLMEK